MTSPRFTHVTDWDRDRRGTACDARYCVEDATGEIETAPGYRQPACDTHRMAAYRLASFAINGTPEDSEQRTTPGVIAAVRRWIADR